MDATTIALVLTAVGVLVALGQWFFPRHPKPVQPPSETLQSPSGTASPPSSPADPSTGLLVTIALGILPIAKDMCIVVDAANPNPRPRRIVAAGLQLDNKRQVAFIHPGSDKGLPCLLEETDKVHYWVSAPDIGRSLVQEGFGRKRKVRAVVTDSYDVKHFSEWTEFDPEYWATKT